jgi:hypothetical protein
MLDFDKTSNLKQNALMVYVILILLHFYGTQIFSIQLQQLKWNSRFIKLDYWYLLGFILRVMKRTIQCGSINMNRSA